MKSNIKKLLASLLVAALVFTMLPTVAFAATVNLSSLRLSTGNMEPNFSGGVYNYSAAVPYSRDTVRVTASLSSAEVTKGSTVSINGTAVTGQGVDVPLVVGNNAISVTVTAGGQTNGVNDTGTSYTINIERLEQGQTPLRITRSSVPDGVVGRRYSSTKIDATGTGTKYWNAYGLPDGLNFNEETGTISGTPASYTEGRYIITVSVYSDSNNTSDTRDFSLTVHERGTDLNADDEEEASSSTAASRPAASRPAASSQAAQTSGVSQSTLISQAQTRINSAAAGAAVNLRYRNLGKVELTTLQAIGRAAGNHAMSLGSERQDANGNVESRVTIDPKKSTKDFSLLSSTTISSENCRNVTELMNTYYSNQVSVIRLDQKGAYGQTVTVYAKLDNARLNTNSLRFYSYDSAANKLEAMTTGYRVSEAGYVTFNANVGNYVIVTDSAMRRK